MQPNYTFSEVNILLVDSDLGARNGVRTILSNNGFSNVTLGTELSKIRDVLTSRMPDLIITGFEFPDGKITDILPDIRNRKLGHNPFIPVIVILGETTPEMVTELMNAGPDDVVMKPISTKGLLQRIHKQIHKRRPFIVTESYLGPARKGDDTSRAVDPPNPLHVKATGGKASFMEVERMIQDAMQSVDERKLENQGPEIAALVGRLVPMLDKPKISQAAIGGLSMLIDLNTQLIEQLEGTRYDYVQELCKAMTTVAKRLAETPDATAPDPQQVRLLKPLSQAIQAGFAGGISSADAARQIVKQIGVD